LSGVRQEAAPGFAAFEGRGGIGASDPYSKYLLFIKKAPPPLTLEEWPGQEFNLIPLLFAASFEANSKTMGKVDWPISALKADAADYRRLLADICRETLWEPIPMGANRRGLSPKDSL